MKRFLIYVLILLVFVLITIAWVLSQADGQSDPFYLKVSSPKQSNLILGTSKSAQGLQPKYFDSILNTSFYNYAFTIGTSPYGQSYLNSIKNKIDTTVENAIHILAVDIWSLAEEHPRTTVEFREDQSFIGRLKQVNQDPNYPYLIQHFDGKYVDIVANKSAFLLHDDGWLEVFISEETDIEKRTKFTLTSYKKKQHRYRFSEDRLNALIETINYLKQHGKVYLVRLPVHPSLASIENRLEPNLNTLIQNAIHASDAFWDLSSYNSKFSYTDGVHLDKHSGAELSQMIARWIAE